MHRKKIHDRRGNAWLTGTEKESSPEKSKRKKGALSGGASSVKEQKKNELAAGETARAIEEPSELGGVRGGGRA